MSGHLLRPCKSTAAFEALPHQGKYHTQLDLTNCQKALEELGYQEVADAKVMIVMKKEIEVTIYPSAKLILKTDSKDIAEQTMIEIYDKILIEKY